MKYNLLYSSDYYPDGFLSPAQVTDYLRCPQCFYFSRILKIPRPLSVHFAIGDALHRSVQAMREIRRRQERVWYDQLWDVAGDTFEQRVLQPLDEDGHPLDEVMEIELGGIESIGKAKDSAIATVKYALPRIDQLDEDRGQILATEIWLADMPASEPEAFPFPIKGKVDCVYEKGIIEDLKTAGKSPDKNKGPDIATGIQLSMYMLSLPAYRGVVDVAVKKKDPDLLTFWLEADQEQRENARDLVIDVAQRISEGDFPPRPNWTCSYIHNYPSFKIAVGGFV